MATIGRYKRKPRGCADCGHPRTYHHGGICGAEGCTYWRTVPDAICPDTLPRTQLRRLSPAEREAALDAGTRAGMIEASDD